MSQTILQPRGMWQHPTRMRRYVMGDPQAAFAQVMGVLAHNGVLAGDALAPDVELISIGDHFDHELDDPVRAGRESMQVLRWLVAQPRAILMFGNHDAARVMELIGFDDARFARARDHAQRKQHDILQADYPDLPTPGLAARDYASYSTEQRAIVIELLLAGRFQLARAEALPDGRTALVTHAAVTERELALLGLPDERDPRVIAAALEAVFATAIADVRADWQRGIWTPLSLAPLHVPGAHGEEGGGLLYHRPSHPDRLGAWERAAARPRRFDPRELPRGLAQIAGHTGHHKAVSELGAWSTERARARRHGGLRTLRLLGDAVSYDLGVLPPVDGATDLLLVDGEMRAVEADAYDLLPLA